MAWWRLRGSLLRPEALCPPRTSNQPLKSLQSGSSRGDLQDNQLWWQDNYTSTIRSKLYDLCLDVDGSKESKLHSNVDMHTSQQTFIYVVRVAYFKFLIQSVLPSEPV